jgi:hypothetical protein
MWVTPPPEIAPNVNTVPEPSRSVVTPMPAPTNQTWAAATATDSPVGML